MAITISGENNNDRILASDGVIDSLSGFNIVGVITATTFTGDLTGDVTGNLTGNVTGNINNSTLLLQTGGTERIRIDSNGRVGLGIDNPGDYFASYNRVVMGRPNDAGSMTIVSAPTYGGYIAFADGTSGNQAYRGLISYYHGQDAMVFGTDGGTERLRITSGGKVCIAHTAALHSGNLQVSTAGADAIDINSYSTNANSGGRLSFYRSKNASIGSNTIVADDDSLGRIDFRGYNSNGNSYNQGATIEARVDGSVNSTTDMPTAILFKTSGDGSASPDERLRITSTGELLVGRTTEANDQNTLVVSGPSPSDVYDNQIFLEGDETSGAADTGGALTFGGHDGANYRNWANIYGMKENGTSGNTASYMAFHTRAAGGAPTERLRITSNGKVNIGTGNLNQNDRMLNLYGGRMRIEGISSGNSFEIMNSAGAGQSNGILCQAGTNSSDINATFRNTSGTTLFRIRGDGKIGIGENDPSNQLHIAGTTGTNAGGLLRLDATTGDNFILYDNTHDSTEWAVGNDSATRGNFDFWYNDGSSYDLKLRIKSDGKYGFNQSSPKYAMHLSPSDGETRIDLHMTNSTTGHGIGDGVQFGYQNSAGAYIWNFEDTDIYFGTTNTVRLYIRKSTGHLEPGADNAQNLGSSSKRWANIYTGDLQLSNVTSSIDQNGETQDVVGNEVDGTQGTWTIQEGSNDLFIINRVNGKKYKFNLTEVT